MIKRSVQARKWSRPPSDVRTANDPQIGLQMIPGPELIPPPKVRNGVDSMKSLSMDTYFLNYFRWRKDKHFRDKSSNTKLRIIPIDMSRLYKFLCKETHCKRKHASSKMPQLCYLINRFTNYPVHFLCLRPRQARLPRKCTRLLRASNRSVL